MAFHRAAATAGEQPEPLVEERRDLAGRHRRHPCRRELDRERNAVETATDLGDAAALSSSTTKPGRPRSARSTNSRTASARIAIRVSRRLGNGQRTDPAATRSPATETLTARGQDPHASDSRAHDPVDEVAHESSRCSQLSSTSSRSLRPQERRSTVERYAPHEAATTRAPRRRPPPPRPGSTDRRQLTEPAPSPILGQHLGRRPASPAASCPHHRHPSASPPGPRRALRDVVQLVAHARRTRQLQRQIRRKRVQRTQRRKLGRQRRMHDLEHPLRTRQIGSRCSPRSTNSDRQPSRRQAHASPATRRSGRRARPTSAAPRGSLRCRSSRRREPPPHRCEDPCAPAEAAGPIPRLGLRSSTCATVAASTASVRRREHRVDPVARRLNHVTAVRVDRIAEDLVMTRQRASHRFRMLLPQPRRTLEIGEQEGDRPRRQLRHPDPLLTNVRSKPGKPDHRRLPDQGPRTTCDPQAVRAGAVGRSRAV